MPSTASSRTLLVLVVFLGFATAGRAADLPANQWVAMNEPNMGVQLLGWDEIRYVPELEGVLFYGAYRSFTSENQNAVWLYRFKENRWHLLHLNLFFTRSEMASDGGHTSGKMTYDELRKVLVYGGLVSMAPNDRYRSWVFDPRALVGWDANPPNPTPNIEYDGASAYAPELKASFQYRTDRGAWAYDALANRWTQLTPPGKGPAVATCEVVYDARRKRLLLFGGAQGHYGGKSFKTFNDLWAFDLTAKTWQKLETKNPPPPRGWPCMALSSAADALLVCCGFSGDSTNGNYKQHRDTWVLKLDTLEWEKLGEAPNPGAGHSNHLAYDPVNDVFLFVGAPARDLGYGYKCGMYAFRYQGKEPAKLQAVKIAPASTYDLKALPRSESDWAPVGTGPVSAVQGWAIRPALAANGKELLLAFGEYEPPGKNWDESCSVHAFTYAGGQWARLGTRSVSDAKVHAQTPAVAFDASGKPAVAYQSIKPWAPLQIEVKRFDKEWQSIGKLAPDLAAAAPALPAMTGGPGGLAVAWQHHPKYRGSGVYASELAGETWKPVAGGAPLNVADVEATRGQFAALARDPQGRLVVAWQEQKCGVNGESATPKRIHVRRLESGKWTELGKEVPVSAAQAQAASHAMTLHGGEPVVAVCAGVDAGSAALSVYAWAGSEWKKLGGDTLNVLGPDGGAFKPALVSDGKSLYVAWPEYLPSRPPLLFVKRWDGEKWSLVGGPLNNAPGQGAAVEPALAILDGKPVVAWTECVPCSDKLQQVFVKTLK